MVSVNYLFKVVEGDLAQTPKVASTMLSAEQFLLYGNERHPYCWWLLHTGHAPGLLEEILHHLEYVPQKKKEKYLVRKKSSTIKRSSSLPQKSILSENGFGFMGCFFSPSSALGKGTKFKSSYYLHNKKKHGLKESEKKQVGEIWWHWHLPSLAQDHDFFIF